MASQAVSIFRPHGPQVSSLESSNKNKSPLTARYFQLTDNKANTHRFDLLTQPTHRIVLKDAGRIRILPTMKKITLTHYENRLSEEQFVRIHRSYLVNVSQVTRIEPYEKTNHLAIPKSGAKLQVSKSGYQRLKEVLGI
jgi:hypothetical protein